MKRRSRILFNDCQPGLFDEFEASIPRELEQTARAVARERLADISADTRLRFMSIGSGSSGNCSYLGNNDGGIIIDAGSDVTLILDTLAANGITADHIKGIVATHDHSDHIRSIYALLRKFRNVPFFCTPRTLTGILRRHNISRRINDYHQAIYKEHPFSVGSMTVTAFDVSHDGSDNVGFYIEAADGSDRFALASDLGCITERVDYYMRRAAHIVIESNYDLSMLRTGRYPEYLKNRIIADRGHLDNTVTAKFLHDIYTDSLRSVFLCHLSLDNNTPAIATDACRTALIEAGAPAIGDFSHSVATRDLPLQLMALPRFEASPMIILGRD